MVKRKSTHLYTGAGCLGLDCLKGRRGGRYFYFIFYFYFWSFYVLSFFIFSVLSEEETLLICSPFSTPISQNLWQGLQVV